MEKSAKWGFNLPNSNNDEIADINVISENFRTIDRVMNETDQTFEPTSTKAASGKAVNEAISGIQPIDENTEFIFDGGNAEGSAQVDIVVDSVLSKTSNNPIANKPVATKFDEILQMIEQAKKDILLLAYPVGAIYVSVANIDPSTLFGGTWEQIKDTFLLAAGDRHDAGETGGEELVALTIAEMPKHSHVPNESTMIYNTTYGNSGLTDGSAMASAGYLWNNGVTTQSSEVGSGIAHNNMPPYIAVYVWKRTE